MEEMTEVEVGNFVLLGELCGKRDSGALNDEETDDGGGEKNDDNDRREEHVEKQVKRPRISGKRAAATIQSPPAPTSTTAFTKVQNAFDILSNGKARGRTAKKQLNYADSDMDDEEESEEERPKKKRVFGKQQTGASKATTSGSKSTKTKKKKKSKDDDEDSDEFQLGSESEDDSFVVDEVESESEMAAEDEDSSDDDYIGKNNRKKATATKAAKGAAAKKKKPAAAAAKKPAAKPTTTKKKKGETQTFEEMKAEKAKDIDVNKLNNPQSFPDDGPFVEPVGIDATGGIVEGIIAGMVQKVGKLLLASTKLNEEEREGGELDFPLKLNTACSGTDAPSIALGLVQENLNLTIGNNQHGFEYEHNMSCELEPFKQAYISRNFPDTKLFPDITKLTGGETVTDVYGREQIIPESE